MSLIFVDGSEPIDRALRRFKNECVRSGILSELKRREHYEKPSNKRRRRLEAARRRSRRRMMKIKRQMDRY